MNNHRTEDCPNCGCSCEADRYDYDFDYETEENSYTWNFVCEDCGCEFSKSIIRQFVEKEEIEI